MNEKKLTHFNESGEAHMVDVHEKADTYRVAKAEGTIFVNEDAFAAISQGTAKKGDVLGFRQCFLMAALWCIVGLVWFGQKTMHP